MQKKLVISGEKAERGLAGGLESLATVWHCNSEREKVANASFWTCELAITSSILRGMQARRRVLQSLTPQHGPTMPPGSEIYF